MKQLIDVSGNFFRTEFEIEERYWSGNFSSLRKPIVSSFFMDKIPNPFLPIIFIEFFKANFVLPRSKLLAISLIPEDAQDAAQTYFRTFSTVFYR